MAEITGTVSIVNPLGLHARPAAKLVETVIPFSSEVYINFDGNRVNAKSIMGLLTLGAAQGSRLTISCIGPDADAAFAAVSELFANGFGEN